MSDAAFLNLICRETGAELLLDIENLYLRIPAITASIHTNFSMRCPLAW
jgi:uncharacterized protein (UPF0276 family)